MGERPGGNGDRSLGRGIGEVGLRSFGPELAASVGKRIIVTKRLTGLAAWRGWRHR